jgi:hypothetical protein
MLWFQTALYILPFAGYGIGLGLLISCAWPKGRTERAVGAIFLWAFSTTLLIFLMFV